MPAFRQDPWVEGQKANEATAEDFLEAFRTLLVQNAKLFGRLNEEDLAKTGVNFKGETVTNPLIARGFVAHVQHHLGQIARIKQGNTEAAQGSICSV